MIQIAICDDETAILEMMQHYLQEFNRKYELDLQIHSYTDGKNLLSSREKYDIIFLDIGFAEENGIQVGQEIRKMDKRVKIIYMTAFSDYMKDAFQVHAFDYIVKPVSEEKIHQILLEAITYGNLNAVNSMTFRSKNGLITLKVEEILYFEYYNRSVLVYDCNDRVFELPGEKISNVAEKMKPYHFEVSHKSFVVNMYQIKSIKGYCINMNRGKMVPLSQLYSKSFRKIMHEYLNTRI